MSVSARDVAAMIDHALLKPTMTSAELDEGCRFAASAGVASVCTMPFHLARCAELLEGSGVRASTVIGFPHGVNTTAVKLVEAERALVDGGTELDIVVNVSWVRSGQWDAVRTEVGQLVELVHHAGQKIKVIFENAYLEDAHKIRLCELCTELGADWVKTSTGYAPTGATEGDLRLMREHSGEAVQIKASGGIRDLDTVLRFREIGVSRCGMSGTAALLEAARARLG